MQMIEVAQKSKPKLRCEIQVGIAGVGSAAKLQESFNVIE